MPKLNSTKSAALGSLNLASDVLIVKDIDEDASSGLVVNVPFSCRIYDITAVSTATNASATVTVSDGTNDISDAINVATNDAVTRAGTIDSTYASVAGGSSLTFTTNGADDRAYVVVKGVRT